MNDRDKDIALAKAMGFHVEQGFLGVCVLRAPEPIQLLKRRAFANSADEAWEDTPRFSEDWASSGMVLGYMTGKGYDFRIELTVHDGYLAEFGKEYPFDHFAWNDTPQRAIRDAALEALGVEV